MTCYLPLEAGRGNTEASDLVQEFLDPGRIYATGLKWKNYSSTSYGITHRQRLFGTETKS